MAPGLQPAALRKELVAEYLPEPPALGGRREWWDTSLAAHAH